MSSGIWDHWYEIVETNNIRQGDIFQDLLVFWLPQNLRVSETDPSDGRASVEVECHRSTYIVMSASCDVDRGEKVYPNVLVGRVLSATKKFLGPKMSDKDFEARLEVIRRGFEPSAFMLPEHPEAEPSFPLSVVQWKTHVTMPLVYLRRVGASRRRLRLKSPFRESFGNWVGGNFQRVGPEEHAVIPEFRRIWPEHILRASDEA